jgi:hypothetical protein
MAPRHRFGRDRARAYGRLGAVAPSDRRHGKADYGIVVTMHERSRAMRDAHECGTVDGSAARDGGPELAFDS